MVNEDLSFSIFVDKYGIILLNTCIDLSKKLQRERQKQARRACMTKDRNSFLVFSF